MNTQALRKQYLESFIDYGYHRNGTWFVVFVTIHHHHPVCPLKGVRVVLTPYSTVLCRWLCPNPPLSHHPEHNPPIVFLVDPYSLFLVPYVPLHIYQALSLPFSSRVRTISVYFLKSFFSALSPSIPVWCLRFSFFLVLLRTRLVSIGSKTSHLCHFQFLLRLFIYYPGLCLIKNHRSYHRFVHLGPVVQSWVSLTLGSPKIQSKLPDSLSINLEIFLQRFCLDRYEFTSLKFWNKQMCRNTQTKKAG
jgi:hypothetical protein